VHIALFCPSFGHLGGIEAIAERLALEFGRRGHRVTVLARLPVLATPAHDGQPVLRFALHQLPRRARQFSRYATFARSFVPAMRALRRTVPRERIDAVLSLALSTYSPFLIGLAGVAPLVMSLQGGENRAELASSSRVFRLALRRARHVVACARSLAAQARDLAPEVAARVSVIPNGVDAERFVAVPPFAHPRPFVLAVGRLAVQKGFDVLLEAFARLGPAAAGVDLLFVGEGPQRSLLEAASARLGLEQRARFLGPLTPEVTATLYRAALLVACPSRWEGLPLVCLEAMASGRAVVGTAVDGIPDAVVHEETGLLVPPDDAGALAGALDTLLSDPGMRQRLGERGRALAVERFSWPALAGRYLTLLETA